MRITVLVDNRPSPGKPGLQTEHGLSLYIEHDNNHILCDMGATELFACNGKALGIDIDTCDFAFISHGHNDHCGGLRFFLENTRQKKVYMHSSIPHEEYFSTRKETRRCLSTANRTFIDYKERLQLLGSTEEITEGIFAVQCRINACPTPAGNSFLWKSDGKKEQNDTFEHELSLAIITPKGLVIISPCSHSGALNIIHECQTATKCNKVYAYIGGLHFVEGGTCIPETAAFAEAIKGEFPDTMFFTGHCTCDTAKDLLEKETKSVRFFSTGTIIEL